MPTNRERRQRFATALQANDEYGRNHLSYEDDIGDLLADGMHWCQERGIDFDSVLRTAEMHFAEELPTEYRMTAPHTAEIGNGDGYTTLHFCLDLANHSPTGFSWGYGGSGPAQLALAILADYAGDEVALKHYQDFKSAVVAQHPADTNWSITPEEIDAVLLNLEKGI